MKVNSGTTVQQHVPARWVVSLLIPVAAVVQLTGLTGSPDDKGIVYQTVASIALFGMFTGVIVFCVVAQRRHVGRPLLGWPGWKELLVESLIALPISIALILALSTLAGLSPELRQLADASAAAYRPVIIAPVFYCIAGITVAPVAEEMLYRAILYKTLRSRMRPFVAALLQALVFGLMHPHGLLYMAMAFAAGLLFMGVHLWRKTLWSPVLVHAFVNAAGVIPLLVLLLSTSDDVSLGVVMEQEEGQAGSRVISVIPGSPAEEAMLRAGDVITAIDHRAIHQVGEVRESVMSHRHGDRVELTFRRNGRTLRTVVAMRARRPCILW